MQCNRLEKNTGRTIEQRLLTIVAIVAASGLMGGRPVSSQQKPGGNEQVIYNFQSTEGQIGSWGTVISDAAGNLYGTTTPDGGGTVFELSPQSGGGWTQTTLYTFESFQDPEGQLAIDSAGNLYGTTSNNPGNIFELSPISGGGWTYTSLYSFGAPGYFPQAGVSLDAAGNIYGTTTRGGYTSGLCYPDGCGTVFELSLQSGGQWTYKTLYEFDGEIESTPLCKPVFDSAGNLYGTTSVSAGSEVTGTVFELSPQLDGTWVEKVIHAFIDDTPDEGSPQSGVVFDGAGNLYGTVGNGGQFTDGIVYELRLQPDGHWSETILHNFQRNGVDGVYPQAVPVFDTAGNLYGTTAAGGSGPGCNDHGCGTVYELRPKSGGGWSERILHSFHDHHPEDGAVPAASGVVFGLNGSLYGTTFYGGVGICTSGDFGCGTVYQIAP